MGSTKLRKLKCKTQRAWVSLVTRERVFADSAGFCQRPDCRGRLFSKEKTGDISIAEVAHIIAASETGPRAGASSSVKQLATHENLILLCANCHTIIDKAVEDFPVATLREWKSHHINLIAETFGIRGYPCRMTARNAIEQMLIDNRVAWERFGPDGPHRHNPESEIASMWRRYALYIIVPNNQIILKILTRNASLLSDAERHTLAEYRLHVRDFEMRHLECLPIEGASRFPSQLEEILK